MPAWIAPASREGTRMPAYDINRALTRLTPRRGRQSTAPCDPNVSCTTSLDPAPLVNRAKACNITVRAAIRRRQVA
jgi:hypothetical protein